MKKQITLFTGLLLIAGAVSAQKLTNLPTLPASVSLYTGKIVSPAAVPSEKAAGDVLWQNNFSSSNNWISSASGSAVPGNNYGWQIASAPNSVLTWAFNSGITSTSGGGYAVVENGTPTPLPGTHIPNTEWILTYDSTFNFSAVSDLTFQFQQSGATFNEKQAVEISVDGGTTWIEIGNNSDLGRVTALGGSGYANPTVRNYNIGAVFEGNIPATLKFRFRVSWSSGSNNGVMYGWFIDDVKFIQGYPNDLKASRAYAFTGAERLSYTRFPRTQATGGNATTIVAVKTTNEGSAPQDAVLTVTNGAYTGTDAGTIPGFGSDSLVTTTSFTIPAVTGTYNFTATVSSSTGPLGNTADDTRTINFAVTEKVMAVDAYTGMGSSMTGGFTNFQGQSNGDFTGIGTYFEIFENGQIGAIDVGIANVNSTNQSTFTGHEFFVTFFRYDATLQDFVYDFQTDAKILAPGNYGKIVRFQLNDPITVTAGEIVAAIATSYVGAEVPIGFSGFIPRGNTIGLNGEDNITGLASDPASPTVVRAPVVRIDFGNYVGLDELDEAADLTIAPNPFADATAISFTLKADAEVSVVVTDLTGREVMTVPATQLAAGEQTITIDGSGFKAGVYNYILKVGSSATTKRVVKK